MLTSCSATLLACSLVLARPQESDCDCHATNARYNVLTQPKTGYDYIPIVADDSQGFYVVYSAKQNETNTDIAGTSCIFVLPLEGDEVLVFSGGYGDTWYVPGGAFFDADYDAAHVAEVVTGCMKLDPARVRVRFVAPHGHPDHITVAFIKALERAGLPVIEIAYHEGDRVWIEQLPWLSHHPALFHVLASGPCNEPLLSFPSPLGKLWFVQRPGHTPGSIDLVLDVLDDPAERVLVLGSASGGCPAPSGVTLTIPAHGTVIVGGPRRAQYEVLAGKGINRLCLSSTSPPKLGTTWTAYVEVAPHADATSVLLFGTDCAFVPGRITPYGELLVDPLGRSQLNFVQTVTGDRETLALAIPRDGTLMGLTCYVQGLIVGGGLELCNALRLVIGF